MNRDQMREAIQFIGNTGNTLAEARAREAEIWKRFLLLGLISSGEEAVAEWKPKVDDSADDWGSIVQRMAHTIKDLRTERARLEHAVSRQEKALSRPIDETLYLQDWRQKWEQAQTREQADALRIQVLIQEKEAIKLAAYREGMKDAAEIIAKGGSIDADGYPDPVSAMDALRVAVDGAFDNVDPDEFLREMRGSDEEREESL